MYMPAHDHAPAFFVLRSHSWCVFIANLLCRSCYNTQSDWGVIDTSPTTSKEQCMMSLVRISQGFIP